MMPFLLALVLLMPTSADQARARIDAYREPPYGAIQFVREQFGAEPDKWQAKVLEAFVSLKPEHKRISMQACAGPGKTTVEAWCTWHFQACQYLVPNEFPKGLATSITQENLRDNLWAEYAKWQGMSPWLLREFNWGAERISAKDHPEVWFMAARTWPKTANAETQGRTLSGIHSKSVLFVVDESGAIPPTVLRAAEQAMPNTLFGKILQGGNPISHEGMLREAAGPRRRFWFIIRITGDPDDPESWVNEPRVAANLEDGQESPADWARQQIESYGRDNPWVQAYILGQFPPQSLNTLLSLEEVEAAQARVLRPDEYQTWQRRLGVDVARFGDDRTVIAPRQGPQWFKPVTMRNAPTTDIAARVYTAKQRFGSELELVDDTGHWGHGVIDNLRAASVASVIGVQFHGKAIDSRYKNRRVEGWLLMADAVKKGAALPNLAELVTELTAPTYTFINGVFALEEKDQIKKRLGHSPDVADAYALTYMLPEMPGDVMKRMKGLLKRVVQRGEQGGGSPDWDPYATT